MKKVVSIILLFLYMIPVIGINASVHYCGGKIASVSFGAEKAQKCACGSKKMKKNCCKDKEFSFKLKDSQQKTQQVTLNFFKTVDSHSFLIYASIFLYQSFVIQKEFYNAHHPPNHIKPSLYILHQVFRI